jgi:hypothetical protein
MPFNITSVFQIVFLETVANTGTKFQKFQIKGNALTEEDTWVTVNIVGYPDVLEHVALHDVVLATGKAAWIDSELHVCALNELPPFSVGLTCSYWDSLLSLPCPSCRR